MRPCAVVNRIHGAGDGGEQTSTLDRYMFGGAINSSSANQDDAKSQRARAQDSRHHHRGDVLQLTRAASTVRICGVTCNFVFTP